MHIKEVIICGFKSYKDLAKTEPLSNKINTVVGANGSGKSNFFQAIKFVLDADTPSLREEERVKILHSGTGQGVLSAYVEIVLDNSDGRMPVDKEEVRIRRTINKKKDEYRLNQKTIGKKDISSYLESAGFSRSNPYYVVQQGKITSMSTMKDEERLDLLKEIGGSKVYEDRRKESLKILHDADARKRQISELVTELEGKLAQLDAEKTELAKYHELDRVRRSVEYAIFDKEAAETTLKLEELEEQRRQETELAGKAFDDRQAAKKELGAIHKELTSLAAERKLAEQALAEATERRQNAVERQARLELDVAELTERGKLDRATQAVREREIRDLAKEVAGREKELRAAKAALSKKQAELAAMTKRVEEVQKKWQLLEIKQGHALNFSSTKERDAWIKQEVKAKETSRAQTLQSVRALEREIAHTESECRQVAEEAAAEKAQAAALQGETARLAEQVRALEAKKHQIQDARQDARREEDKLGVARKALEHDLQKLARKVDPAGYNHAVALATARDVARNHNIPVHGTVLQLVGCMPQLYTAVEVAAGGALFHLVLDDHQRASQLLDLLRREGRGGRVTCLPLDKLKAPEAAAHPTQFGNDAVPLTKYLSFDSRFDKVFGKWMVCKDGEVASKVVARTSHVNCVTIHGDVHAKKGTISGGFRDETRNRLAAHHEKLRVEAELAELAGAAGELQQRLERADQEMLDVVNDISQAELQSQHKWRHIQAHQARHQALRARLADLTHNLDAKRAAAEENRQAAQKLADQIAEVGADLGAPHLSRLTADEQREKQRLRQRLDALEAEMAGLQVAVGEAEAVVEGVEGDLGENLRRRLAELREQVSVGGAGEAEALLAEKRGELAAAAAAAGELGAGEKAARARLEQLDAREQELASQADQCRELQKSDEQLAQEESATLNQLLAKRAALEQKHADLEKKIRDLGAPPADAIAVYCKKGVKQLQRDLSRVQAELKGFSHVNKKALDQYMNFTDQRASLVKRHEETARSKDKIRDLINVLDQRKNEAISRTFRGIAKNFKEMFAELSSGGSGELVMQKAQRREQPPDAQERLGLDHESTVDHFSGVKVKVSFGAGETMSMKQLSGGQKTLVALALIFSIQRLDPAPFYLFDEIDAALDSAYRTTVAKMLAKQANDPDNPSQFIITTFHPQIIHETDMVLGVAHQARRSTIETRSREAALAFVTQQEKMLEQAQKA